METITLTVDTEHADALRRQIAWKCALAAEILHSAADAYTFHEEPASAFQDDSSSPLRSAVEEIQTWAGLLDALGWDQRTMQPGSPGPWSPLESDYRSSSPTA